MRNRAEGGASRSAPLPGKGGGRLVVVGVLTGLVALLAVLQLRSQVEVQRSLDTQDNTSLAFLIDDLHRANDSLQTQATQLTVQRDQLKRSGGRAAQPALLDERQRLRVIEGLDPVHGPGVVIGVDAPLSAIDLQDAVNNLRVSGAEAIAVNDHRVIAGTVVRQTGTTVTIDGGVVHGPWTFQAVGDPVRLADLAEQMTRSLRADSRVRSAVYRSEDRLEIRATAGQRPFVYGSA
jgi:uncharacterized protein YlxW (UPF0749 family)